MKENFLHFIWRTGLFDSTGLKTTDGDEIKILSTGEWNKDAGPDFLHAKIRIGKTIWAGHVEIHILSSDWNKHKHSNDAAYANVILHVVWQADSTIINRKSFPLPAVELKDRVDRSLLKKYEALMLESESLACCRSIHQVDSFVISQWLSRVYAERLEQKSEVVNELLFKNKNNWEESFYQHLMSSFGGNLNGEPMNELSRILPLKILAKHKNNLFQLEALLFGGAGILQHAPDDDYVLALKKEWAFLQKKYSIQPMRAGAWKFLRLRPPSFPTIRIAQFAQLVRNSSHLFSKILETENLKNLRALFDCTTSEYWTNHYVFGKESKPAEKNLGDQTIQMILLNTVSLFLFAYGKAHENRQFTERALRFIESIPAESNRYTKLFTTQKISPLHAGESQAMIQLYKNYCREKKCVDCGIGYAILQQDVK